MPSATGLPPAKFTDPGAGASSIKIVTTPRKINLKTLDVKRVR